MPICDWQLKEALAWIGEGGLELQQFWIPTTLRKSQPDKSQSFRSNLTVQKLDYLWSERHGPYHRIYGLTTTGLTIEYMVSTTTGLTIEYMVSEV